MKTVVLVILSIIAFTSVVFAGPYKTDYEAVAVSQTDQVLGSTGGIGDLLERLIIYVSTSATGTVAIKDGTGNPMNISPANIAVGVYSIEIGARSTSGAWKVTTGAGASVMAVGSFK